MCLPKRANIESTMLRIRFELRNEEGWRNFCDEEIRNLSSLQNPINVIECNRL